MKKIMLIAAVMFAAIAANAAIFKWSAANIYDHTGTAKFVGEATLYAYLYGADASTAVAYSTVTTTATGAVPATTFSSDELPGGSYYNFFFVIEDGDYTFKSAEKVNVAAYATQTQNVAFGNLATVTQTPGSWVSSAVPEPTSGLLLLLGMAGLALKRKIA